MLNNDLNKSQRRQQIFRIIKDRIGRTGEAPTIRELMREVNARYPREIAYHLEKLEDEGYIERTNESSRNIRILRGEEDSRIIRLPLVGVAPCGPSILAEENILDYVSVPAGMVGSEVNSYLIRASGDSMMPLIQDRDLLVISRREDKPKTGDIIVALVNNEVTVKKFNQENNHVLLQPLNIEKHNVRVLNDDDDFQPQGKVVGVIRTLTT